MIPTSILLSLLALIGGQFLVERVFQFNTTIGVIINFVGGTLLYLYLIEGGTFMIEVKNISKKYGSKAVVNNVSFQIKRGKITSFIGPNGAGKSTVLGMMSRLLKKDSR